MGCRSRSARTRRTITKSAWRRMFSLLHDRSRKPDRSGDRAYDSDPLDEELRNDGIQMIAPHRSNRSKPPTQDRRRLSRRQKRWLVERFFAGEYGNVASSSAGSTTLRTSSASVQLACLVVLFKRFSDRFHCLRIAQCPFRQSPTKPRSYERGCLIFVPSPFGL